MFVSQWSTMLLIGRREMSRLWTLFLTLGLGQASAQILRNKAGLEANPPQATSRCVSYDSNILVEIEYTGVFRFFQLTFPPGPIYVYYAVLLILLALWPIFFPIALVGQLKVFLIETFFPFVSNIKFVNSKKGTI